MKFLFNSNSLITLPDYGIKIPPTHDRVLKICELLRANNQPIDDDFDTLTLTKEDLERVHTKEFVAKIFGADEKIITDTYELINTDGSYHRYDPSIAKRPLSEIIDKVLLQTKGTMTAVKEAMKSGEAYHLGGGHHHAMSFAGRGFCLMNDIVIASRWAQRVLGAKLIWIIDVDAHKGDGTAELTQNDPSIRTLSIHMKEGWPLDSRSHSDPWFIDSDIEIGVAAGEEPKYHALLKQGLHDLEKLDARIPDLAIVVQGSDPYEKDQLPSSGLLKLTKHEMLERDMLVYEFLKSRKVPQAYVMAGGYGEFAHEVYCEFISYLLKRDDRNN